MKEQKRYSVAVVAMGEGWMPQLKEENVKFCKKKWVGPVGPRKIEEKICIFVKKWVGPKNIEEKICIFGKKLWVGTKRCSTNFLMICSAIFFLTLPCLRWVKYGSYET